MSRRDDVSKLYGVSNALDRIEMVVFTINFLVALIALINNQMISTIAVVVQIVAGFLYFIISVTNDGYFLYEAEKARRKNAIENGLGTRLSELETEKYYNNSQKPSLEKYALNLLESNLFSKEIAGKMILGSVIKSAFAVAILIVAYRSVTNLEIVLIIAQATFSSFVVVDTLMLILYKQKMDKLFEEGYKVLITPGVKKRGQKASILAYSVEYEAIKAHYKIRLSERLFKKNNSMLNKQWKKILLHRGKPDEGHAE